MRPVLSIGNTLLGSGLPNTAESSQNAPAAQQAEPEQSTRPSRETQQGINSEAQSQQPVFAAEPSQGAGQAPSVQTLRPSEQSSAPIVSASAPPVSRSVSPAAAQIPQTAPAGGVDEAFARALAEQARSDALVAKVIERVGPSEPVAPPIAGTQDAPARAAETAWSDQSAQPSGQSPASGVDYRM